MFRPKLILPQILFFLSLFYIIVTISGNLAYAHDLENYFKIQNVSIDLDENNYSEEGDFSFGVANPSSDENKWSTILGHEFNVHPDEKYYIISNMGLNEFAVQSHISIEGYNESSQSWIQLLQCPHGIDGPLKLIKFVCSMIIPPDINKIRPAFEAGWSSNEWKKALTTFEQFLIIKEPDEIDKSPIIFDSNLVIQKVINTYLSTSQMKFLGPDDMLLIDEHRGLTYRLSNGTLIGPLSNFNLVGHNELMGVEGFKIGNSTKVYLYYYETKVNPENQSSRNGLNYPKCLCLYEFDLVDDKLINPKPIMEINEISSLDINSIGDIQMDHNHNLFLVFSTKGSTDSRVSNTTVAEKDMAISKNATVIAEFFTKRSELDERVANISDFRYYINSDIKNSSDIKFDPVTKNLWIVGKDDSNDMGKSQLWFVGNNTLNEKGLLGLNGDINALKDLYTRKGGSNSLESTTNMSKIPHQLSNNMSRLPAFTWNWSSGPETIEFLNSTKIGGKYTNTLFVSDPESNYIYNFNLDKNRTNLELDKSFENNTAEDIEDLSGAIFAVGLGTITDIQTGPDGYLYLLDDQGQIFRIVPKN